MEAARAHEVYDSLSSDDAWTDWLIGQRDSDDSGYMEGEEDPAPEPTPVPAHLTQRSVRRR